MKGPAMDWQPIDTVPRDGTRVELKREGFDYGFNGGITTGVFDAEKQTMVTAEFFIDPRRMVLSRIPTHWRPIAETAAA